MVSTAKVTAAATPTPADTIAAGADDAKSPGSLSSESGEAFVVKGAVTWAKANHHTSRETFRMHSRKHAVADKAKP